MECQHRSAAADANPVSCGSFFAGAAAFAAFFVAFFLAALLAGLARKWLPSSCSSNISVATISGFKVL